jgi:SAM-dependent methyltransferase
LDERSDREREFHEERFSDGVGARDQDKYYTAVSAARALLDSEVDRCTRQGGTGLEVGCSTGENLERLLTAHAFEAHGIDISAAAVAAAQARMKAFSPMPALEVMDANHMRFGDGLFDFCFGSGVLHHLALPDAVYEVRRVLRPGGLFLFLEPLATNPIIRAYRRLTPAARSADETPLTVEHLSQLRAAFPGVRLTFFGFLTIACVALNRWPRLRRPALALASALDRAIFALPGAWRLAWVVVIRGQRAIPLDGPGAAPPS